MWYIIMAIDLVLLVVFVGVAFRSYKNRTQSDFDFKVSVLPPGPCEDPECLCKGKVV